MFNRVNEFHQQSEDLSFLMPQKDISTLPLELRELLELQASENSLSQSDTAAAESDWPVNVFIPERYEERYSYPLIVWFHNDGGNEDDLEPVMKAMSPQNYCGLALRGNHRFKHPEAYGWNQSEVSFGKVSLASLVNVTARRLRKAFHIHSERIFVAGSGTGADIAMQLLLTHPDWFAGAVLMDPPCDLAGETAVESGGLRGKHVLQTVSRQSPNAQLARNVEMVRLLRTCGADIDVRMTDSELDVFSSDVRFVDHWLISRITSKATLNS